LVVLNHLQMGCPRKVQDKKKKGIMWGMGVQRSLTGQGYSYEKLGNAPEGGYISRYIPPILRKIIKASARRRTQRQSKKKLFHHRIVHFSLKKHGDPQRDVSYTKKKGTTRAIGKKKKATESIHGRKKCRERMRQMAREGWGGVVLRGLDSHARLGFPIASNNTNGGKEGKSIFKKPQNGKKPINFEKTKSHLKKGKRNWGGQGS